MSRGHVLEQREWKRENDFLFKETKGENQKKKENTMAVEWGNGGETRRWKTGWCEQTVMCADGMMKEEKKQHCRKMSAA